MPLGLYKPGQGKWSRGIAAVGLAAVGLWAAIETRGWMLRFTTQEHFYIGNIVPALLLAAFLWAAWFVANRAGTTDFIIETENEMKKVTWPSTREVVSSTAVVVVVTLVLGVFLWVVDRFVVQPFFEKVCRIL